MPNHNQSDRKVKTSEFLECRKDYIEIIIADVKNVNNTTEVKFNKGLRRHNSSIFKLIEWLGIYEKTEEYCVEKFKLYLNNHGSEKFKSFTQFEEKCSFGNFNFKFTFFCPQLEDWNGKGYKYINFAEISNYIWDCLNSTIDIESCSRSYNYQAWNNLEKYVRFFKQSDKSPSKIEFESCFKEIKI
jgi:hypothetical protein